MATSKSKSSSKMSKVKKLAATGNSAARNYLAAQNKPKTPPKTTPTPTPTAPKTPNLPSAGSVVDFLSSQKKDSSYGSRTKMYEQAGLNKTLGGYTGSSNQNTALLNYLKSGSKPTPTSTPNLANIGMGAYGTIAGQTSQGTYKPPANTSEPSFWGKVTDFLKSSATGDYFKSPEEREADKQYQTTLTGKPMPVNPAPAIAPTKAKVTSLTSREVPPTTPAAPATTPNLANIGMGPYGTIAGQVSQGTYTPPAIPQAPQVTPQGGGSTQPIHQALGDRNIEDMSMDEVIGALNQVGMNIPTANDDDTVTDEEGNVKDEQDYVDEYMDSIWGKFLQEKLELDRMKAERENEVGRRNEEEQTRKAKEASRAAFESRGLSMSGMKFEEVDRLSKSLAESLLDVDAEYAEKLLDLDYNFRVSVYEGVADLIEAQEKADDTERKEAQDTLEAMGYVYYNGQLMPTLAREREAYNREMDEDRFNLSRQYYNLAVQKFLDDRGGGGGGADDYALLGFLADNEGASLVDAQAWAGRNTSLKDADVSDIYNNRPVSANETDTRSLAYNMMYEMVSNKELEPGWLNFDEDEEFGDYMMEQFEANLTAESANAAPGERSAFLPVIRDGNVITVEVPELSIMAAIEDGKILWKELYDEASAELEE